LGLAVVISSHKKYSKKNNKRQPGLDLLSLTEVDRQALTKHIKECLQQKATEARLEHSLLERVELLDTDVHEPEKQRPETRFQSWCLGN
jgi:hypothetical protein